MRSLLITLAFIGSAASAAPVVQDMTCSEARAFVAENEMYYLRTEMAGDIPMMPVYSADGPNRCGFDEIVSAHVRPTTDVADCFVGYSCTYHDTH